MFTVKQKFLMAAILRGNPDNSSLDMDQILENLIYKTSKQSLQHSLRPLIKKGLIQKTGKNERVKRRGAWRSVVSPTVLGIETFTPYLPTVIAEEQRLKEQQAITGEPVMI